MTSRVIKIILTSLVTALVVAVLIYLILLFGDIDFLPESVCWIVRVLCAVMIGFSIYLAKRYLED